MEGSAEVIKSVSKNYKQANRREFMLQTTERFCNPVRMMLHMKIVLLHWVRYVKIYDDCDKDSVDIDSDDFSLEELRPNEAEQAVFNQNPRDSRTNSRLNSRKGTITRNSKLSWIQRRESKKNSQCYPNRRDSGRGHLPLPNKNPRSSLKAGTHFPEQSHKKEYSAAVKEPSAQSQTHLLASRLSVVNEQTENLALSCISDSSPTSKRKGTKRLGGLSSLGTGNNTDSGESGSIAPNKTLQLKIPLSGRGASRRTNSKDRPENDSNSNNEKEETSPKNGFEKSAQDLAKEKERYYGDEDYHEADSEYVLNEIHE